MRWFAIAFALGGTGCLSVVVSGQGQTSGQTAGGSGGQSTGATTGSAPVPICAPNSHYVGDVCVLDSCGTTSPRSPCLLSDGGIGTCAAGNCLSTANDHSNCGGAGYVCAGGAQCFDGQCRGPGGGLPMGDGCNCPSGTSCTLGPICTLQACGPGDDDRACGDDGFCCHGVCIPFGNDDGNCGGCGTTCPAGTVCGGYLGCVGAATCETGATPGSSCELGDGRAGMCCGAACVDWNWDSENCGGCDLGCPPGLSCDAGFCIGSSCDAVNCPGGGTCLAEELGPSGGEALTCVPPCPAVGGDGQWCPISSYSVGSCCEGQCVPFRDRANCGGCGIACAPNQVCAGFSNFSFDLYCVAAPSCSPGEPPCIIDGGLGTCCATACIDPGSDGRNCGECGSDCPAGAICEGAECMTIAGTPAGACGESIPCQQGDVCAGGHCTTGACNGTSDFCVLPSGARGTCCGTKCTDTDGDSENCGGCGEICPAGSVCGSPVNATCSAPGSGAACPALPCPAGSLCARNGSCVRLGDCSNAPPGQPSCSLSARKPGTCCNGQCTDLGEDPNNCGLCGLACASGICAPYGGFFFLPIDLAQETSSCLPLGPSNDCLASCGPETFCLFGACVPATPLAGGPCIAADGTVGFSCPNGVCAHPRDDPQNCGACGNACPPGVACVAGACAGSVCGIGRWGDFCGDAGERTCCPGADCTDTQTDPLNCGFCGWECPPGTSCSAGACG